MGRNPASWRFPENFETSGIILATFAVVLACALMGCMGAAMDLGGVIGDNGSDSFSGRRSWSPDTLPDAPDTHPELPQPPTWTVAPWTVAPWIVGPGDGGDPNPGGPNWGWGAGAAWPWSPHRCDPCFKPGYAAGTGQPRTATGAGTGPAAPRHAGADAGWKCTTPRKAANSGQRFATRSVLAVGAVNATKENDCIGGIDASLESVVTRGATIAY